MIYDPGGDLNIPQIYFNGPESDSNGTGSDFCETESDMFWTGSDIVMTGSGSYVSLDVFLVGLKRQKSLFCA